MRTSSICIEIYKILNNLNSKFLKELFRLRATKRVQREKYKFNLQIPESNQLTFGTRSLRIKGSKVWNLLLYHMPKTLTFLKNL